MKAKKVNVFEWDDNLHKNRNTGNFWNLREKKSEFKFDNHYMVVGNTCYNLDRLEKFEIRHNMLNVYFR
jgi:hypothetical protein